MKSIRVFALLFALLCLLVCGCSQQEQPTVISEENQFCHPQLQWNMSPAEVAKALGVTESDLLPQEEWNGFTFFSLENQTLFEENVTLVFQFDQRAGDELGLYYVFALFRDDVHMEYIMETLAQQIGEGTMPPVQAQDGIAYYWDTEENLEKYKDAINPNRVTLFGLPEEHAPVGRVIWTKDYSRYFQMFGYTDHLPEWTNVYHAKNMIVFAGYVAEWLQYIEFGYPGTN